MQLSQRTMGISPSPTLAIDAKAKQIAASGVEVINFSAGEPDFDTPDHIKEAAIEAIRAGMTKYTPVGGTPQLKKAIIDKLRNDNGLEYKPEEIVVSAGAKHSLYNAFQVVCQPGDEVILPAPYWVSYLEQIKLAGAVPKIVWGEENNGFKITPQVLESVINKKTKVLIINSPSNPTGSVYNKRELAALAEVILKHNLLIISDEIYEKLIYDGEKHISIASLSSELKERTVLINGVSKAYAMTGWRIGYAAAPSQIAKAMTDLQSHATSNPTSIAQQASVAALAGSQESLQQMIKEFTNRRNFMFKSLSVIRGITCNLASGAFYLFPQVKSYFGFSYQGKTINSASDLADVFLEEAKVAVVPGIAFGSDDYIRLSYATSLENIRKGLDRIARLLSEVR